MKKLVWLVGAMCAAAAGCLVLTSPRRIEPSTETLEDRTYPREDAWRDHRSTV
jgi:hypothetical protein